MKIIEKDILTVKKGIICQQVNCQGVMGSGLAKSIREKWPIVYDGYLQYCKFHKNDFELLGTYQGTNVDTRTNKEIFVINIFGQLKYGYDGKRYTDYAALKNAFSDLSEFRESQWPDLDVYLPFNFGCDRGGADWKIVSKMIESYFPNAIICKLPK